MQKFITIVSHLIYYSIFLLIYINLGFFLGFPISKWHIPVSLALYFLLLIIIMIKNRLKITLDTILLILFTILIFLIAGFALSHTFDTSYDGQLYQQTAVISLSRGWNPIWDKTLPISAPIGQYGMEGEFGKPFVIGYPKSLWSIQSAIYLFSGKIQIATITNLIAGLIAFIFLLNFLLELNIYFFLALIISIMSVLGPHFIIEFTSFMVDGFIYQISIVAAVSLLTFMMKNKISSFTVFYCSWLLLAGTKYSSIPIVIILAVICLGYLVINGLFQNKYIQRLIGLFFIIGILLLFSPYIVNFINYGSPVYPDNLAWGKEDVKFNNTPINLKGKSRGELLFYGIFSKPQISTPADNPANIAYLKLPFTFNKTDLTQVQSERVGTSGIFFSGLIILSIIFLSIFLFRKQSTKNYKILMISVVIILLIILSALALPVPNVMRFTPQIYLIPIITLVGIIKMNMEKPLHWLKILTFVFFVLISVNISSILIPIVTIRFNEFTKIKEQLQKMSNSHVTYRVYAQNFYSSYLRLRENNIKFIETADVGCQQPGILERTFSTKFCPSIN